MGSPKKQRKKFEKPSHPWQKERILEEKELKTKYGLRRKYEIWKMNSILKKISHQAKKLIGLKSNQADIEKSQLIGRLNSLGLLGKNSQVADVLSLTLKDIMERRLQTVVYKKKIAKSILQARQLIVHKHITIKDKKINSPSYLVHTDEESHIQFSPYSSFSNPEHPERYKEKDKK